MYGIHVHWYANVMWACMITHGLTRLHYTWFWGSLPRVLFLNFVSYISTVVSLQPPKKVFKVTTIERLEIHVHLNDWSGILFEIIFVTISYFMQKVVKINNYSNNRVAFLFRDAAGEYLLVVIIHQWIVIILFPFTTSYMYVEASLASITQHMHITHKLYNQIK